MNMNQLIIGMCSCILLVGCDPTNDAKMFNKLDQTLNDLSALDLEELQSQGHLSASYRFSGRYCGGSGNIDLCNKMLLSLAEGGHPSAMGELSMRMTSEKLNIYNLEQAYVWTSTKMHFVQPLELSDSDYVRSYQLLDKHEDVRLIKYLEDILTNEEIITAKIEADKRARELWQKLQEYCEDWKEKDYVCWYSFNDSLELEDLE